MIQEAYIHGVSTRAVDDLVRAMGGSGVSKSQVSRLCAEIDGKRPLNPAYRIEPATDTLGFERIVRGRVRRDE